MNSNRTTIVSSLVVVCFLASLSAFGATGDKAEVKGMITTRTGETLIVNGENGKTTVVLDDSTKTQDRRGLFGWEKTQLGSVVLIPGLKVQVKGVSDEQDRVVAKTITVDGDDVETAEMIQAGLNPTAEQVAANVQTLEAHNQGISANKKDIAANQQDIAGHTQDIATHTAQIQQNIGDIKENTDRFTALADYDVKGEAKVQFNSGSSKISAADVDQLKQLAQTATALKGYIIEVTGYADSTGNAAMNTKLSEDRAKAVVTALMQQGGVPVRHIVAPGA
ncbi:MAG TPA: OmpA family protein, partial [Acidobacteriaceae bacterium]